MEETTKKLFELIEYCEKLQEWAIITLKDYEIIKSSNDEERKRLHLESIKGDLKFITEYSLMIHGGVSNIEKSINDKK